MGPIAQTPSVRMPRPDENSAFMMGSLSDGIVAAHRNALWLDVVFRKTVSILSPIDRSRQLFLSVFLI
jgi:hypothetical protein